MDITRKRPLDADGVQQHDASRRRTGSHEGMAQRAPKAPYDQMLPSQPMPQRDSARPVLAMPQASALHPVGVTTLASWPPPICPPSSPATPDRALPWMGLFEGKNPYVELSVEGVTRREWHRLLMGLAQSALQCSWQRDGRPLEGIALDVDMLFGHHEHIYQLTVFLGEGRLQCCVLSEEAIAFNLAEYRANDPQSYGLLMQFVDFLGRQTNRFPLLIDASPGGGAP